MDGRFRGPWPAYEAGHDRLAVVGQIRRWAFFDSRSGAIDLVRNASLLEPAERTIALSANLPRGARRGSRLSRECACHECRRRWVLIGLGVIARSHLGSINFGVVGPKRASHNPRSLAEHHNQLRWLNQSA